MRTLIVLTGGPCGGKSALLSELEQDPDWAGRFVGLRETVGIRFAGVSPCEKLFQRVVVEMQAALEDAFDRALGPDDERPLICHRGTLDPLAFWLARGWEEEDFFTLTQSTREEHHQRYAGVIHLVTAADGASEHYLRWPEAHRPETPEEAVQLDRLLRTAWDGHPNHFLLGNEGRDWAHKSDDARRLLHRLVFG